MKPRETGLTLFALTLTLIVASPAAATHGGIHPGFRSETVYFHCNGPTKIYQVNWLSAAGDGFDVSWNTSPPAGSATNGNGCGGFDFGGSTNEFYDPVFRGTFTGNLRDMTVRIYNFAANATRTAPTDQLRVYAELDGIPIFPAGGIMGGRVVTVTPTPGNSGLTDYYEFSITNIGYANEIRDSAGNVIGVETGGAALEDGSGEIEHDLRLFVGRHGTWFGDDPGRHTAGFWVWDATEVPAGITFNPAQLAAATVQADLPEYEE